MLEKAIRDALADTVQAASAYAAKFHAYAFLWTQQSGDVLAACMQTAREQTHHVSAGGYAIMETFKKEVSRKKGARQDQDHRALNANSFSGCDTHTQLVEQIRLDVFVRRLGCSIGSHTIYAM